MGKASRAAGRRTPGNDSKAGSFVAGSPLPGAGGKLRDMAEAEPNRELRNQLLALAAQ
jgi:hypothetical protein